MSAVRRVAAPALVALLALLAALLVPTTSGALTTAISNSTDTAASGIWAGGCADAARTVGTALFVWPLDDAAAPTARDVSSAGTRTGTYVNGGTGGRIAYGQAGPCAVDGGKAVTVTGSAANAVTGGYLDYAVQQTNPQTFSAAIWFKTTTTTGGKLIGFGSSATGSSGSYDRHIYMTNTGNLTAGVYTAVGLSTGATTRTVTTGTGATTALNNGAWHLAVMTLGPATDANPGLRLYVDAGAPQVDTSAVAAQVFNGYWRVGYDNLGSWPNAPTNYSFTGSLAFAQVYSSVLTPTQVSALYAAGR